MIMAETVRVEVDELFNQLHQKYTKVIAGLVTENAQLQAACNQQADLINELTSKVNALTE
jgi:hypothetical protein